MLKKIAVVSHTSKNNSYTVAELVHDASFRRIVEGTASPDEIQRWTRWRAASGRDRRAAKKAAADIAGFGFTTPELPGVEGEWRRLDKNISAKQVRGHKKEYRNSNDNYFLTWIFRVAV